jgi:glycosyltransferase 2 family protein
VTSLSIGPKRSARRPPGYDVVLVDAAEVHRSVEDAAPKAEHRIDRTRAVVGGVVLAIVFTGAAIAIYRQREAIASTLRQLGLAPMLLSGVFGLVGVAVTFPLWREVLGGLGVRMPWVSGSRVFFISQLGKYVPGSIWPVLMQMEAGRARGASRRTMLAGNLITVVLGCAVGLVLACALLPAYNAVALERYWWLFLALPLLLDWLFGFLHRPPLGERLQPRSEMRAVGWSLISWAVLGAQLLVLCAALGHGGLSAYILCVGAIAFAVSAGVLLVPVPAGAGIRDVLLALMLGAMLDSGEALAVAIASRVILIFCDVLLALMVSVIRIRRPRGGAVEPADSGELSRP